jgi:hypothetical protein
MVDPTTDSGEQLVTLRRNLMKAVRREGMVTALTKGSLAIPSERHPCASICATGDHMVYHMVMARKEVLVQLDDELIERLDRLADTQGTNRSELLRRGAAAVLEAAEQAEADRLLQDAYRRVPQDPAIVVAATRLAAHTAPEW